MQKNINFILNKDSDTLFVVLSGISGGKDEPLVAYLSDAFKDRGSVLGVQFSNDPLYHDDALSEMEELTFDFYFDRIDSALKVAEGVRKYTSIVFIAHSYSAVVAAYYFGLHRLVQATPSIRYVLVTVDNDSSEEALKYLDALSEKDFKDKTMNPFHPSIITYMREHNSAKILSTLDVRVLHIDAQEVGVDHNFESDESKHLLVQKIASELSTA